MLEIGSIIDGKYKILEKIGQGAMGNVYLALNEKANKSWAIKEVKKDGINADAQHVSQGLMAETEMLKRLNHPHLPSIIDVIDGDGTFLVVMDYIEGKSLGDILKEQGAQPQESVIDWAKQLCDILGYLHTREKPIIYRDMKPSNVMLKPDGNVVLIDFGIAREYKYGSSEDTSTMGTRQYAAPEQFGGHGQTDGRTDIYGLGSTMYHLITGHKPKEPPNYKMLPIRQLNPALSSGIEAIIYKCTLDNPADRYQSCEELMYDLEHYKDLEEEAQRDYKRKWKTFLVSSTMFIICALCTVGFKFASISKKNSTYESYIDEAESNVAGANYDEAWENYEKAIELMPERGLAYLELLNNVIIDPDGNFDSEESAKIKQLLTDENLNKLKEKDSKSYYELYYALGNAYYYFYNVSENESGDATGRNSAGKYYSEIEKNNPQTLDKNDLIRASALAQLCSCISKLDNSTILADGSRSMSYKDDLWVPLNQLISMEYDIEKDRMLAVRVYESFYGLVERYKEDIYRDGVEYTEMLGKLEQVRDYISEIKQKELEKVTLPESVDLDRDLENLNSNIMELQNKINKSALSSEQNKKETEEKNDN